MTDRQAVVPHKYSDLAFDLPEVVWEGLDDASRDKLREQYSKFGSMLLGMFEAALLNPKMFPFVLRLVSTNLAMMQDENTATMDSSRDE